VITTGATLPGKVDPHGCATTYRFEYGTTTAYGMVTPDVSAGSGTRSISAAASIARLAPHTVYHFRIVATSAAGTTGGRDFVFKTRSDLSSMQIIGGRASVKRGFVAIIRLSCSGGSRPCQGTLAIFRKHRLIGRHSFFLAANSKGVVSVRLNPLGQKIMLHHRRRRAEVVARSRTSKARAFLGLIRNF
jgi:hypothetical protein